MIIRREVVAQKLTAAYVSLVVGVLILLAKFSAYLVTRSTAVFSDALESVVNVVSAIFLLISLYLAKKPADADHPYGHGKAEFLSAGFEGAAIIGAAFLIIYKVVEEMFLKPEIHALGTGSLILGVAALINFLTGLFLIRTGKKNASISLEADGRHLLTDVVTSIGVIVGIILIKITGVLILDSVVAVLVAIYIIFVGGKLFRRSLGGILDRTDEKDRETVSAILSSSELHGRVCGFHRLRNRRSGGLAFVDFHLLFPRDMSVVMAHEIATEMEVKIASALGDAGVMAHIEPCKDAYCETCLVTGCKKHENKQG